MGMRVGKARVVAQGQRQKSQEYRNRQMLYTRKKKVLQIFKKKKVKFGYILVTIADEGRNWTRFLTCNFCTSGKNNFHLRLMSLLPYECPMVLIETKIPVYSFSGCMVNCNNKTCSTMVFYEGEINRYD